MKTNIQIRGALRAAGIPLWRVADELGCSESTVLRRLRHELSPEDRQSFQNVLERLRTRPEKEVAV